MRSFNSIKAMYLRNFTFGAEDSLSSTVGLLSGIATAHVSSSTIIITGLVLIFTEALAMAVGSFLSEQSVEELEFHREIPLSKSLPVSLVMFSSYLVFGLIPLFPYALFTFPLSLWFSISATLSSLAILGLINSRLSHTSPRRQLFRMLVLGGSVAVLGIVVGNLLS